MSSNVASNDGNKTTINGTAPSTTSDGTHGLPMENQHQQTAPMPPPAPSSGQPPQTQHLLQTQQPPPNQQMSESNKRAALAGQWRTPPLPVFPTSASSNPPPPQLHSHQQLHHHHHHHQPPPQPPNQQPPPPPPAPQSHAPLAPATLPDNTEDYAKALQEAYRRGAEAAAAMAAHQQQMSPSVSCPNFQMTMAPAPPPPPQTHSHPQAIMASRSEDMTAATAYHPHTHTHPPPPVHPVYHPSYAEPHQHQHAYPDHQQHPSAHVPPPPPPPQSHLPHQHPPPPPHHQYTAPPPPPAYVAPAPNPPAVAQPPPPPPPQSAPVTAPPPHPPAPTANAAGVPNPLSNMPPPPNKPPPPTQPPPSSVTANQVVVPPTQRSVSLPDMTSYAVQAEEEKRQKRLARNRASARLRRLRKKNLVDAYETEVGILEKTLQQLKAHEWGVPSTGPGAAAANLNMEKSHQSLLEALCMDRGQQVISSEQRAQQCQDILEQQLQQMDLLRQVQFEQQLLAQLASGENKDEDPELADMAQELSSILALSDDQKAQLQENSRGLEDEMTALDTVFSSLVMMKENEWLLNQGVQDITDQLTSILHKNQMSKFLLWADANVEAIDQLDHVHAAPKNAPHPHGPIFTFGVETTPMEDEGDGK